MGLFFLLCWPETHPQTTWEVSLYYLILVSLSFSFAIDSMMTTARVHQLQPPGARHRPHLRRREDKSYLGRATARNIVVVPCCWGGYSLVDVFVAVLIGVVYSDISTNKKANWRNFFFLWKEEKWRARLLWRHIGQQNCFALVSFSTFVKNLWFKIKSNIPVCFKENVVYYISTSFLRCVILSSGFESSSLSIA